MLVKESVDSTSEYLKRLLHQGYKNSLAVLTTYQTAGKGQFGRSWISEEGKNLLLSIRLLATHNSFEIPRDNFHLQCNFLKMVYNVVSPLLGKGLNIKWPNDFYYEYKKIGGVLMEVIWDENRLPHIILGVGLNVNQLNFDDNRRSTSIAKITGTEHNIFSLAHNLEKKVFDSLFTQMKSLAFYNNHLLFRGEWVNVYLEQTLYKVKIQSVQEDGSMILQLSDGGQKCIMHHYHIKWERLTF